MKRTGRRASAQQVMREHLRTSIRSGALTAVDLGSYAARAVSATFDPQRLAAAVRSRSDDEVFAALRIVGAAAARSSGVAHGEIVDIAAAADAMTRALSETRRAASGETFALLTMGGGSARGFSAAGAARLPRGQVEPRDVERALAACDPPAPVRSRETIHAAPSRFLVDGRETDDPLHLEGARLDVEAHYVTVNRDSLRATLEASRRAGVEAAGVVAAPYASGLGCLLSDEMALGAACVDMGAETTSVAVFRGGRLSYVESVPVGGRHVSRDVAAALELEEAEAERIKTLYGDAVASAADDRVVTAKRRGGGERRFSRSMLIRVIRPRLEETFELARSRLEDSGFYDGPNRPIALTGGGAQMSGALETARRILGRRARLGKPVGLDGMPRLAADPSFSAVVGLLAYAARVDGELWSGAALARLEPPSSTGRALIWLRNNW